MTMEDEAIKIMLNGRRAGKTATTFYLKGVQDGEEKARKEFERNLQNLGNNWEVGLEFSDGFQYVQFKEHPIFKELSKSSEEKTE